MSFGQNVLGTKHPEGQNVPGYKTSLDKMYFCNIDKNHMFYVLLLFK